MTHYCNFIWQCYRSKERLGILDTCNAYDPCQVRSNLVGLQHNWRSQNRTSPNHGLGNTSKLEGLCAGHWNEMRNILPIITNVCNQESAPDFEEHKNVDLITVSEDIQAFFILERNYQGDGGASYPWGAGIGVLFNCSREALIGPEYPNNWTFPRPQRIQEVNKELIPWACSISPLVQQPSYNPPHLEEGNHFHDIWHQNRDDDTKYFPKFLSAP